MITAISREEFKNYKTFFRRHIISFGDAEKAWFIDEKKYLLGIVKFNGIDNGWTYMIFTLYEFDNYGIYREILLQDSMESQEEAKVELIRKMTFLLEHGSAQEKIYDETSTGAITDVRLITDINEEVKKYLKRYPKKLYELSPRKFEELIASILEDMGFSVELTNATRDGGKDIMASIKKEIADLLLYIECKRYSPDNKVGLGIIREVSGVHYLRKPSKSIIVTTSFFTTDAIKEAKKIEYQLELRDYDDIKSWLKKY